MSFSINFTNEPVLDLAPDEAALYATITIGDFQESIFVPTNYWSREEYIKQWTEGAKRLLSEPQSVSALVSEMGDPVYANFIKLWPLYREGDVVHIQNSILFLDEQPKPFKIEDLYSYVSPRTIQDEDGQKISEWNAPITDFVTWLEQLNKQ